MKKLYRVTVEYSYYALALNQCDAQACVYDATDDLFLKEHAWAQEVLFPQLLLDAWTRDSRVYGTDDDETTLGEALDALAEQAKQETVE